MIVCNCACMVISQHATALSASAAMMVRIVAALCLLGSTLAARRLHLPFDAASATDGKVVQKAMDAAIAKGASSFTLPKGNV